METEDRGVSELRFKLEKAVIWAGLALAGAGLCDGQPTQVHLQTQGRAVDFSNTASTRPVKVGPSLPASCLTGEQFHLVTAPSGQNLYLCTSMNTWAAVTDGNAGLANAAADLTDCRFTRSSAQVLTMSACRVRIGTLIWSFPETAFTLGAQSPADSVYFFVLNGSLVAGYSLGSTVIGGSGFSSQSGVNGFPPESLPLARWDATVTPGQWNPTGEDLRALLQRSVVEPGIGLMAADHPSTGVRTLALDTTTTPQFTSGTAAPPAGCSVGQVYLRTSSNQSYHCTSENTWSEVTQPASISGASAPPAGCSVGQIYSRTDTNQAYQCTSANVWTEVSQPAAVERIQSAAARCRAGVAEAQANLPAVMAPAALCAGGANTLYGVLQFPDADGEYSLQDSFRLPADWAGAIDFSLVWRSADAAGNNVVWQLQTACAGDGESGDPAWNAAQTIVDAAAAAGNALNSASLPGVTATGCAAGETLFWRLARDRSHAEDTLAAAAELISYEWTLRRTQ